jgi:PiT family inorganic phosphate transporter
MEVAVLVFLSSGLFLGWSLGANDAANVFGTAVGSGMVRFATAAVICSVFVILGAVISGAGAAHTLSKLGAVNAIPGAFMVAFAAAVTVYAMTKASLPVSTTQAIVGSIVGWNLYTGSLTSSSTLITLIATWVICPTLAAAIAAGLFKAITLWLRRAQIHIIRLDAYTRTGLLLAGAFGAYSLGANNIANVMGVFVPVSPFTAFSIGDLFTVSSAQQLFLLGSVAIAVGVFTYSKKVMMTVGSSLMSLSPVAAFVVVVSHSIVLFLFASQNLENFLASYGLPTIPLVPVSSSQAVIGAVVGIGLLKGGRGIRGRVLGNIAAGWAVTPFIAGLICFVSLFFLQNVFNQQVSREVVYEFTDPGLARLAEESIDIDGVKSLNGRRFTKAVVLADELETLAYDDGEIGRIIDLAEIDSFEIHPDQLADLGRDYLTPGQFAAVGKLSGRSFTHRWMLDDALIEGSEEWALLPDLTVNKIDNRRIEEQRRAIYSLFRIVAAP